MKYSKIKKNKNMRNKQNKFVCIEVMIEVVCKDNSN